MIKYWQLATGRFFPQNQDYGQMLTVKDTDIIKNVLRDKKKKILCVNDTDSCDFDSLKPVEYDIFASCFPNKSSFEKD